MTVTKQQIINGVVKYAKNEIINKIIDKPLKMIIATCVSMMEVNPSVADVVFNNPMVSAILREKDGMYDIDGVIEIIEKTMNEYGDFPVKIPAIKFVSPSEKELTFAVSDVKKLREYIIGVTESGSGMGGMI